MGINFHPNVTTAPCWQVKFSQSFVTSPENYCTAKRQLATVQMRTCTGMGTPLKERHFPRGLKKWATHLRGALRTPSAIPRGLVCKSGNIYICAGRLEYEGALIRPGIKRCIKSRLMAFHIDYRAQSCWWCIFRRGNRIQMDGQRRLMQFGQTCRSRRDPPCAKHSSACCMNRGVAQGPVVLRLLP